MFYYKNDCEMCPCILSAPGYCMLMLLSTQLVLFDMSQPATHGPNLRIKHVKLQRQGRIRNGRGLVLHPVGIKN